MAIELLLAGVGCSGPIRDTRPTATPIVENLNGAPATILSGLVSAHNQERNAVGLPRLVENAELESAARRHARDMAAQGKMSHRGSDHSSPFQRMESEGYRFQRAAENIALGEFTLKSLMSAWMTSPPHRRNILGQYTEIGTAYATAEDGRTYWCVTFGTPLKV